MIVRKTPAELEKMRRSGMLVYQLLEKLKEMAMRRAIAAVLVAGMAVLALVVLAVQRRRRRWF